MNRYADKEIRLKLLKLLQDNPKLTQRQMNKEMGISLGKVNYCLCALIDKGMIKMERFKKQEKKSAYLYRLTPEGIEELASLTLSYLKFKINQYDQIKKEIQVLTEQIDKNLPDFKNDDELNEYLKNIN